MVEKWLLEVEEMMVVSVRAVIGQSYTAYVETSRRKWVLEWPGQVVICTSSIYWTLEVTAALKTKGGTNVIKQLFSICIFIFANSIRIYFTKKLDSM